MCHEYVCQKLLKLDNPSSSYGKKQFGVFFMPTVYSHFSRCFINTTDLTIVQFLIRFD